MTNTTMLEEAITRSGYKKSYIAAQIGVSTYALSLKVRNENEFKASEIDALCRLLDIDVNDRMLIFFAQ